uniref:Uncharacterized protein n=1 Tax=Glossina palpalis gambiensis TaxID=67801 RepID=A0A1B0BPR0_9MUSC
MCNLHMRHTPDFRSMGVLLGVVVHAYNQTTAGAVAIAVAVAVAVAAAITIAFDITLVRWWFHGGSRRQGEVLIRTLYGARMIRRHKDRRNNDAKHLPLSGSLRTLWSFIIFTTYSAIRTRLLVYALGALGALGAQERFMIGLYLYYF